MATEALSQEYFIQQNHNMGETTINLQDYKYSCLANTSPIGKQGVTRVYGKNKGILGNRWVQMFWSHTYASDVYLDSLDEVVLIRT